MSLIQDALRRQQEESEGHQPARPPAAPEALRLRTGGPARNDAHPPATLAHSDCGLGSVAGGPSAPVPPAPSASVPDSMPTPPRLEPTRPPPMEQQAGGPARNDAHPPATLARSDCGLGSVTGGPPETPIEFEPRLKSWQQIVGIIVLCLVVVWGGIFLLGLFLKTSAAERSFAGLLASRLAQQRQGAVGEAATEVQPAEAEAAPAPWISPAAASAPAFAGEDEVKDEETGLKAVEQQLSAIPSPVVWPRLKLSAIFAGSGSSRGGARLNNRLVMQGDKIEGVTLIEIRLDGVKLQSGSATKFLKMGATLR